MESLKGKQSYYIGVEIGGTKQQIAVGTKEGIILERKQVRLGKSTAPNTILEWIFQTIGILRSNWDIIGVGVGFGGPVDPQSGTVVCSFQVPGWEQFCLPAWFQKTFNLPAVVRNDTLSGGLGELYRGSGCGSKRFFYTNIGTGIGGGLYWPGGFGASSLGYAWVPDWTNSNPGSATRLEYLCAGPFIEKRLNTSGYVPADSCLKSLKPPYTCSQLAECARKGDRFCCAELDRIARTFSLGLADVLALAFPDRIAVGGGVAKMGDILFSRLRRFTEQAAFPADIGKFEIIPAKLMDDAVLTGSLLLAGNPEIAARG